MANTKNNKIVLKDGIYFTALYNRKKIRGIVQGEGSYGQFNLCNSKFGYESDCPDEFYGFSNYLEIDLSDPGDRTDSLKNEGITSFKVCTDRRQKAIIDSDKWPEIMDLRVKIEGDEFTFGCGAVTLTREQISNYAFVKEKLAKIDIMSLESIEFSSGYYSVENRLDDILNLDEANVEALLKAIKVVKGISKEQIDDYENVISSAKQQNQEDELEGLSVKDIKWLLANY